VDGLTVADVEASIGVPGFLDDLRTQLKDGSFRPLPVRERKIPKPGGNGKVRRLGIPTIADRVVQAALKLVLEPIFEADFQPVSYGFRPMRRAHDAIAEIQRFGTKGYRWVLDADIEACFDSIFTPCPDGSGAGAGQGQAGAHAGEGVPQSRDHDRTRRP
jgi:RNA-directed DNA polymerase